MIITAITPNTQTPVPEAKKSVISLIEKPVGNISFLSRVFSFSKGIFWDDSSSLVSVVFSLTLFLISFSIFSSFSSSFSSIFLELVLLLDELDVLI